MTMKEYLPCDVDGDGGCDADDLLLAEASLGSCESTGGYLSRADADHDGCVTAEDLTLLSLALESGCGVNPPTSLRVVSGPPAVGSTLILEIDNPLGTQAPGSELHIGI